MNPKGETSEGIPCAQYLHALQREGVPEERVRYYTGWVESFRRFQKSRLFSLRERIRAVPIGRLLDDQAIHHVLPCGPSLPDSSGCASVADFTEKPSKT